MIKGALDRIPASVAATANLTLRDHLDPDDPSAIARVHETVYHEESGFKPDSVLEV
jgi:hypothetical protein